MAIKTKGSKSNGSNGSDEMRISPSSSSSPPPVVSLAHLPPEAISRLKAMESVLVERFNFALNHGFDLFNGNRDLFQVLGYKQKLEPVDYKGRYRRGGIAQTIVDFYPKEIWSGGFELIEDEDPKIETEFERTSRELYTRLQVSAKLFRATVLAGLGRYSVILIGAPGSFETELPKNLKPENISYLTPYAEDNAQIVEWVTGTANRFNERYGLPLYYSLKIGNVDNLSSGSGRIISSPIDTIPRVHWSRIIHVVQKPIESDIFGLTDLEACWNLLDDLYKIVGAGAEQSWRNSKNITNANVDAGIKPSVGSLEKLEDEIQELNLGMRDFLLTQAVDVKKLGSVVDKFGNNGDFVVDLLAGTSRIAKRRMIGSERGELASSQDEENTDDETSYRRGYFAEPLIRQLTNRFVDHGVLKFGGRKRRIKASKELKNSENWSNLDLKLLKKYVNYSDLGLFEAKIRYSKQLVNGKAKRSNYQYQVVWPTEEEMSEREKATSTRDLASANLAQSKAEGKIIITSDEIRDKLWKLEPLEMPDEDNNKNKDDKDKLDDDKGIDDEDKEEIET